MNSHLTRKELTTLKELATQAGNAELTNKLTFVLSHLIGESVALTPTKASSGLLNSMCMRYRHDFGLDKHEDEAFAGCGMTEPERDSLRRTMSQLHEEVVGTGFYSVEREIPYTQVKPIYDGTA